MQEMLDAELARIVHYEENCLLSNNKQVQILDTKLTKKELGMDLIVLDQN